MTPEQQASALKKIFDSNPVGKSLRPLLRPFDHLGLDPEIYKAIAEVLMLAYQEGVKGARDDLQRAAGPTTEELMRGGKAVRA